MNLLPFVSFAVIFAICDLKLVKSTGVDSKCMWDPPAEYINPTAVRKDCKASSSKDVFYDAKDAKKCVEYTFSGCGVGGYGFKSIDECDKTCVGQAEAISKGKSRNTICNQPADVGHCQNETLSFHYDPIKHHCTTFKYTGCGGNSNRFATIKDCWTACY